jgi:tetratricopeptide (TPR) repeat protein
MFKLPTDIDILELYRRSVPKSVRKIAGPRLKALYCAAMGIDALPSEGKRAENAVVRSANQKFKQWRLDDALEELDILLRENPDHRSGLHLKADVLARKGDVASATKLTKKLLKSRPLDLRAIHRLKAMGKPYSHHVAHAERAISIEGRKPQTYLECAQYLNDGGLADDAIRFATAGLGLPIPQGDTNLRTALLAEYAHALEVNKQHLEAIDVYQMMDPKTPAYAKMASRYALCLLELDRPHEAEQVLVKAYRGGPIPYNAALVHTLNRQGRVLDCHKLYRARTSSMAISEYFCGGKDPTKIDLKSGAYADKRCLFIVEGGPGDEIRFSATYNELTGMVGQAAITCEPRLTILLRRSFPQIEFIPTTRHRKELLNVSIDSRSKLTDMRLYPSVSDAVINAAEGCDFACSILDTLADTRPDRQSFQSQSVLTPNPDLVRKWHGLSIRRAQIGIAWRSLLRSKDRNHHYLLASDIAGLGGIDADFWLLQPQTDDAEIAELRAAGLHVNIPDIDLKDDFEGQAALMSCLDAVVAPLTTTAELAGMLGVPTIIFGRSQQVIWRRNDDGSDVWYRNGRFVTGQPLHDVPSLIQNIASELAAITRRTKNAYET